MMRLICHLLQTATLLKNINLFDANQLYYATKYIHHCMRQLIPNFTAPYGRLPLNPDPY